MTINNSKVLPRQSIIKKKLPFWLALVVLILAASAVILAAGYLAGSVPNINAPTLSHPAAKPLSYAGVVESVSDNQLILKVPDQTASASVKLITVKLIDETKYVGLGLPKTISQTEGEIQLVEQTLSLKDFKAGDQITVAGRYDESDPDVLVVMRVQKFILPQ